MSISVSLQLRRVKIYELLPKNEWLDRGTGYCNGVTINNESRIQILCEDDPAKILFEVGVSKDEGYQKQQDTLIVWTEKNGTDMALSFQESEGCSAVWEFIHNRVSDSNLINMFSQNENEKPQNYEAPVILLPPAELQSLAELESLIISANSSPSGREALAKAISSDFFFARLVSLVEVAESMESLVDLHRLCNIVKIVILLNDSQIIEYAVIDEMIYGVVGALEYESDFPLVKSNHREYLRDQSHFKEVIRFRDEQIRKKIQYTYRIQYLKDVVLARILDDPTSSVLNSIIFFLQVDIVQYLLDNTEILEEFFSIFNTLEPDNEETEEKKRNGILFIQQCCSISKNLQIQSRSNLYSSFISCGLFNVVEYALKHSDSFIRTAGANTLVSMLDHDPIMVRNYIFSSVDETSRPLTDTLIELLLIEDDYGVRTQLVDSIKILLDPNIAALATAAAASSYELVNRLNNNSNGTNGTSELNGKFRNQPSLLHIDAFIQAFYDSSARKLFKPLKDLENRDSMDNLRENEVSLFTHLIDILSFFLRNHSFRSKYFIVAELLACRVVRLLDCNHKHLQLTALKFLRTCVGLNDEYYNKQIIRYRLLDPVLRLLFSTLPKENLPTSACLELFEFIRSENLKPLICYIVENHRRDLEAFDYVDPFQGLILRYIQRSEEMFNSDESKVDNDNDNESSDHDNYRGGSNANNPPSRSSNSNRNVISGAHEVQAFKEFDAYEEAYYNGSDNDDAESANTDADTEVDGETTPPAVANTGEQVKNIISSRVNTGFNHSPSSPPRLSSESPNSTKSHPKLLTAYPLVSYDDDDDDDSQPTTPSTIELTPSCLSSFHPGLAPSPPERLSEKRRRVDDDDGELGKLLLHSKRRSISFESISEPSTTCCLSLGSPLITTVSSSNSLYSGSESLNGKSDTLLNGSLPAHVKRPQQSSSCKSPCVSKRISFSLSIGASSSNSLNSGLFHDTLGNDVSSANH